MSIKGINWVLGLKGLTHTEQLTLVFIANRANEDDNCWPSVGLLAKELARSKVQTRRILKHLETAHGVFSITPRDRKEGSQASNLYTLNMWTRDNVSEDVYTEYLTTKSVNNDESTPSHLDESTPSHLDESTPLSSRREALNHHTNTSVNHHLTKIKEEEKISRRADALRVHPSNGSRELTPDESKRLGDITRKMVEVKDGITLADLEEPYSMEALGMNDNDYALLALGKVKGKVPMQGSMAILAIQRRPNDSDSYVCEAFCNIWNRFLNNSMKLTPSMLEDDSIMRSNLLKRWEDFEWRKKLMLALVMIDKGHATTSKGETYVGLSPQAFLSRPSIVHSASSYSGRDA